MDIVIIGKARHNRGDAPSVVYCGQSREEAAAAVAATAGKFAWLYQLNPEPAIPVRAPAAPTAPAASDDNSQKKQGRARAAKPETATD